MRLSVLLVLYEPTYLCPGDLPAGALGENEGPHGYDPENHHDPGHPVFRALRFLCSFGLHADFSDGWVWSHRPDLFMR